MEDSQFQTKQQEVTVDVKTSNVDNIRCFNEKFGGLLSGTQNEGPMVKPGGKKLINVLDLKAAQFAIMTFTKMFLDVKVIRLEMGNMVAFSFVKQIEGAHNKVLSGLTRKIWDYLILIMISIR